MRPIEIQSAHMARATGKVSSTTPARPASPVASGGDKDVEITRSELLSGDRTPAIDTERVAQVRQAIAEGTYPLVPARIADAMIAAKFLWRSPE